MSQCFKTSDLAALNASLLYDDNHDDGSLWVRPSPGPLPVCSSLHPSGSSCFVCCLDQMIFAVCQNLSDSVKMTMEGYGLGGTPRPIDLEKTACPQLITEGFDTGHHSSTTIILVSLFLILITIIGMVSCRLWIRNRGQNPGAEHLGQDRRSDRFDAL